MTNTPLTDSKIEEIIAAAKDDPEKWPEVRKLAAMQCHAERMEINTTLAKAELAKAEQLYSILAEKLATLTHYVKTIGGIPMDAPTEAGVRDYAPVKVDYTARSAAARPNRESGGAGQKAVSAD